MKVTMDPKPTMDFLKNRLQSVKRTRIYGMHVSIGITDPNPHKVEVAKNMRVTTLARGGFIVEPTSKRLSSGITAKQAYKMFEFGTSKFPRDPISYALRGHVQRVIIPQIIKKMGRNLG